MPRKKSDSPPPAQPRTLTIESDSFVPYYQQIVDQVRSLIRSDVLSEGDTFKSEGEIARDLGISKMPVRQAFLKLRAEGLLVIRKGKRPVIGTSHVPWDFQQLRGFSEEMRRRGFTPSAKVLSLLRTGADAETARALRLNTGGSVYALHRLRYIDGQPVALVTSYMPAALFPGFDSQDLENQSLYHVFETTYARKLNWAEEEIGAVLANEEQARALKTTRGSALLFVRETTYDSRRTAIEYSRSFLRADRYTATVISVRKR